MVFAGALVSIYLTSGYALQSYVRDQLDRIPWDLSAVQRDLVSFYPQFQQELHSIRDTQRVAVFGLLRVANTGNPIQVEINGQPIKAQWLAVVASSAAELLPPELQVPGSADSQLDPSFRTASLGIQEDESGGAHLTRILRLHKTGQTKERDPLHGDDDNASIAVSTGAPDVLFEARIEKPVQLQREKFNRWLLRNVGSTSYLPDKAIVVAIPMGRFAQVATVFEESFGSSGGLHGGTAAPPFIPELTHLIRLNRDRWVTPWLIAPSIQALAKLEGHVLASLQNLTIFSSASSDTVATLTHMNQVSHLTGLVTLLVAVPMLWLGWAVASILANLLLVNERRLIGLALMRGVPSESIRCVLFAALGIGGSVGGILGVIVGIIVTVTAEKAVGEPTPPLAVLLAGVGYYILFALLGAFLTALSARATVRRITQMTPREAVAYVTDKDAEMTADRGSRWYWAVSAAALALGSIKIVDWVAGWSALTALSASIPALAMPLTLLSGVLNLLAVPCFLFGVTGVLRGRPLWVTYLMSALTAPVAGRLRWFVAEHMAINGKRIAGTMFVSALAMSLALLPQVAADCFYGRLLRGVAISVGGDLQLQYSTNSLTSGTGDAPKTIAGLSAAIAAPAAMVEQYLRQDPLVASVSVIDELVAPNVYIPSQNGLTIDLIRSSADYLKTVDFEEGIGLTRKFSAILNGIDASTLAASAGFLRVRKVTLNRPVELGRDGEAAIAVSFADVLAFLPGQPSIDVVQREGYAPAEVDYLNYLLTADARAISSPATFTRDPLSRLALQPSKTVFLVRLSEESNDAKIQDLIGRLPTQPEQVRWRAEERRHLARDMFISLALANLKVFMVGGLILALAGTASVGFANFLAERRTFALLRVRGVPVTTMLRISLALFLAPIVAGVLIGSLLGAVAGYGLSVAVWQLPRVYGVAGLLAGQMNFSAQSGLIIATFSITLLTVAVGFALWPFRRSASESVRRS